MNQENNHIVSGDRAIAIFDGWEASPYPNLPNKLYKGDVGAYIEYLNYHENWNLLMPVVEKIEKTVMDIFGTYVLIDTHQCKIYNADNDKTIYVTWGEGSKNKGWGRSKIEATWLAVIDFITWYNNSQKQTS